ncbi:PREDICTED: uncharacterized protein LOC106102050 [Papilio polytes]|uniref:uncharacterized protein LOC106102050 n=1 Tax=Papilio polytes TaxID=76194 RepID=UPI0006760CD2|nr:PREDICTED: uncharacterized protein LOC106102050 [Papilio polytes]
MDIEDLTLEEKCENLMNVVVESRKRFSKMCVEYEQKSSIMENKMLNLQLESLSKARFKSKHTVPNLDVDSMKKEVDDFTNDIQERQQRIEKLYKSLRNTEQIVLQLKEDKIGMKLKQPLTAESRITITKSHKSK